MSIAVHEPVTEAGERAALALRLAAWMLEQGITGHYGPLETAARVAAANNPGWLAAVLDQGGSDYLRHRCENIRDLDDLTDAEFAAEEIRHGHPGRRLEVVA